ncbi:MAG: hypothetical protein IFK94_10870 [Acidobacteria bacterium]|uniref:Lipoprotein n=1 Tax=Candidatus Polarisedimenticola svalbardensis TaxID=2886004 RepID=A0A8J6Y7B3_9BACT|nr:hypothetical protein [Candidatus Polarisedimenticola svalbardensis]
MVRRFLILTFTLVLLAGCGDSPVPPDPGCPDGMVIHPMWQGEYPGPVIHVIDPVEVPTFADPCDPYPSGTCTLTAGVFHPWGDGDDFVTLRPVEPYTAKDRFTLEETIVEVGETVLVTGYLAENICAFRVREETIHAECLYEDNYPLEALPALPVEELQFFRAGCEGWILVDEDLFDHQKIVDGAILEWGKVGPG